MKDWRKSPEPTGMMGIGGGGGGGGGGRDGDLERSEGEPSQYRRSYASRSLADMARRVIVQKIHLFHTFGQTPFALTKPILEQCSAKKLWSLEEESPQYIPETNYMWKRHCLRDYKDKALENIAWYGPGRDPDNWRELYRIKALEDYEAKQAATARIKEKYAALRADKQASQVRIVAGLPTAGRKVRSSYPSGAAGTVKSTQGQRMMNKARKQAHIITKAAHAPRSGELSARRSDTGGGMFSARSPTKESGGDTALRPALSSPTPPVPFDFARKKARPGGH